MSNKNNFQKLNWLPVHTLALDETSWTASFLAACGSRDADSALAVSLRTRLQLTPNYPQLRLEMSARSFCSKLSCALSRLFVFVTVPHEDTVGVSTPTCETAAGKLMPVSIDVCWVLGVGVEGTCRLSVERDRDLFGGFNVCRIARVRVRRRTCDHRIRSRWIRCRGDGCGSDDDEYVASAKAMHQNPAQLLPRLPRRSTKRYKI